MATAKTKKAPAPQAVETLPDPVPESIAGLHEHWYRAHASFLREVIALRSRATAVDRALIISAVRSLAAEEAARDLADKAVAKGEGDLFLQLSRLAQAEGRAARSALANLGLSGDRRGVGGVRRAGAAALDRETLSAEGSKVWGGLL